MALSLPFTEGQEVKIGIALDKKDGLISLNVDGVWTSDELYAGQIGIPQGYFRVMKSSFPATFRDLRTWKTTSLQEGKDFVDEAQL